MCVWVVGCGGPPCDVTKGHVFRVIILKMFNHRAAPLCWSGRQKAKIKRWIKRRTFEKDPFHVEAPHVVSGRSQGQRKRASALQRWSLHVRSVFMWVKVQKDRRHQPLQTWTWRLLIGRAVRPMLVSRLRRFGPPGQWVSAALLTPHSFFHDITTSWLATSSHWIEDDVCFCGEVWVGVGKLRLAEMFLFKTVWEREKNKLFLLHSIVWSYY